MYGRIALMLLTALQQPSSPPQAAAGVTATPTVPATGAELLSAIEHDDGKTVGLLLSAGVSPDVASPDGKRAIVVALRSNRLEIARALVTSGASLAPVADALGRAPILGKDSVVALAPIAVALLTGAFTLVGLTLTRAYERRTRQLHELEVL